LQHSSFFNFKENRVSAGASGRKLKVLCGGFWFWGFALILLTVPFNLKIVFFKGLCKIFKVNATKLKK
jgi:hypothetical protein